VESLLKQAFLARRKMLRNTLAGVAEPQRLKDLAASSGFSLKQRPQELAPAIWVALARGLNRGD
jgi:16S rRNA (adenine1518-N6/adenine1519-N6)-dimethyltransferase